MTSTVSEILWVRWLLKDFWINLDPPTPSFCGNQTAWHILNNPVFHERTKHVEINCFFFREKVESKFFSLCLLTAKCKLRTCSQKVLVLPDFSFLTGNIGITKLNA